MYQPKPVCRHQEYRRWPKPRERVQRTAADGGAPLQARVSGCAARAWTVLSTCSAWPIFLPVRVLITIACSAALALVVVATAPASSLRQECDPYCPITKVSFTSVVSRNDYATLKVNVRPRARCTIKVVYSTGPSSAVGLRAKIGGLITWRWKVGSNTKLGRWPVIVDCGSSGGSARFTFRVVR